MPSNGFVKVHRQIQAHWLFAEPRRFSRFEAWVDMLLLASFQERKVCLNGTLYDVGRGDLLWSQRALAKRWDWSMKRLRGFFAMLEKEGMIKVSARPHLITQVTLLNYDRYQGSGAAVGPGPDTPEIGSGPQVGLRTKKGKQVKKVKAEREIHLSAAVGLYEYYAEVVRPGGRADALRSICKLLPHHSTDVLRGCIQGYADGGLAEDPQYRIQANNFFGRARRFEEFLQGRPSDGATQTEEAAGLTDAQRFVMGRSQ